MPRRPGGLRGLRGSCRVGRNLPRRPSSFAMQGLLRICALAVIAMTALAAPVHAQSFLEKLFGFGTPRAELPPPMPSYRAPIRVPPPRTYTSRSDEQSGSRHARKVRTVCVRLCDGYYFPISHATSTRNLLTDSDQCKSRCGGDARLFYSDSGDDPDPASMVDMTGRRYDALDNAFAYRKALRPGCSCKPPPWSATERVRHFKYALEQAQTEMKALAAKDIDPATAASVDVLASRDEEPASLANEVATPKAGPDTAPQSSSARDTAELTRPQHVTTSAAGGPPARRMKRVSQTPPTRTPPVRQRYSKAGSSSGATGFFGFGQNQKHVWPGDAR